MAKPSNIRTSIVPLSVADISSKKNIRSIEKTIAKQIPGVGLFTPSPYTLLFLARRELSPSEVVALHNIAQSV